MSLLSYSIPIAVQTSRRSDRSQSRLWRYGASSWIMRSQSWPKSDGHDSLMMQSASTKRTSSYCSTKCRVRNFSSPHHFCVLLVSWIKSARQRSAYALIVGPVISRRSRYSRPVATVMTALVLPDQGRTFRQSVSAWPSVSSGFPSFLLTALWIRTVQ